MHPHLSNRFLYPDITHVIKDTRPRFSILQATKSLEGPGNEATVSGQLRQDAYLPLESMVDMLDICNRCMHVPGERDKLVSYRWAASVFTFYLICPSVEMMLKMSSSRQLRTSEHSGWEALTAELTRPLPLPVCTCHCMLIW